MLEIAAQLLWLPAVMPASACGNVINKLAGISEYCILCQGSTGRIVDEEYVEPAASR
jgi:hypothetical protein